MAFANELLVNKMASGELKTSKNRYGSYGIGVLATVLAADGSIVMHEKLSANSHAELISHKGLGNQVTITLPGCRTDGEVLSGMFRPQLTSFGDSHFIKYPERGFDISSIKDCLIEARLQSQDKPVSVLALSMGGIVLMEALKDSKFRQEFGFIDRLVLDSSPSEGRDLRPGARFGASAATILQNSWAASNVVSMYMYKKAKKRMSHDDKVSDQQVNEHFYSTNHTPLYRVSSQAELINHSHTKDGALTGTVGEIAYIQSSYDSVINTSQAAPAYGRKFNVEPMIVTDSMRPIGSHASAPEYQTKLIELIDLAKNLAQPQPAMLQVWQSKLKLPVAA